MATPEAPPPIDVGEPAGVLDSPARAGCADGSREGFRQIEYWPNIAGCAGGFEIPGVVGSPDLLPVCDNQAGDRSHNPAGQGCNAADLCARGWRMCRDGADVAKNSSSGGCEGCVPAGERRFFLVASGAEVLIPTDETDGSVESPGEGSESSPASIGICLPVQDRGASSTNDLHGCGGLGQPESPFCAPLLRRMNFADCALTNGVWWCGVAADRLQEARVVTKPGPSMGGALCCRT